MLPRRESDRFAPGGGHGIPLPLARGVACYAVAATLAKGPATSPEPGAKAATTTVLGDGLVPVASALGDHPDPARALSVPIDRRFIAYGMNHLDLLSRPEVYAQLREWLQ